jgi:HK97 gp10 family phage protein
MAIEVKGAEELIAKLKRLAAKDAKTACRKGTRKGAKVILDQARAIAPERTGTLRRNIKIRQRTNKGTVSATVQIKTGNPPEGAYYGSFVEFGTKKLKGEHFLQDAADSRADDALGVAVEEIAQQIEELSK